MKCIICGTEFTSNKYNKNRQKYCSRKCREISGLPTDRRYSKYRRKLLGSSIRNGTSELSDLSIITFNGQERIKGMVVLEALINKMKRDKSVLFDGEHL